MKATVVPTPPSLAALVVVNAVTGAACVLAGLSLAFDSGGGAGAVAAGIACAAVGLVAGLTAILLRRRRPAGRGVQIGLAAIGLPLFPFWTAASAWTLVTMSRRAERTLLSGRREEEWTPEEAAAVASLPAPSKGRAVVLASGLLLLAGLEGVLLASLPPRGSHDRARQKRTVAEMRSAMTAIESFAAREGHYPEASSMDDLARLLEPTFVARLPRVDAWGHPLRYESWKAGAARDAYLLASPGRDGAWEGVDLRTAEPRTTRSPDEDLLVRDGELVRAPDGARASPARGSARGAATAAGSPSPRPRGRRGSARPPLRRPPP